MRRSGRRRTLSDTVGKVGRCDERHEDEDDALADARRLDDDGRDLVVVAVGVCGLGRVGALDELGRGVDVVLGVPACGLDARHHGEEGAAEPAQGEQADEDGGDGDAQLGEGRVQDGEVVPCGNGDRCCRRGHAELVVERGRGRGRLAEVGRWTSEAGRGAVRRSAGRGCSSPSRAVAVLAARLDEVRSGRGGAVRSWRFRGRASSSSPSFKL